MDKPVLSPMLPLCITEKQWCCLVDAISGLVVARTLDRFAIWTRAADGAILHPHDVVDELLLWGVLDQVAEGRWIANGNAAAAMRLPFEKRGGRSH